MTKMYLLVGVLYFFISFCNTEEVQNLTEVSGVQYSLEEQNALEKFRPMVSHLLICDSEKTDGFLIKWLRAKNLSLAKAADLLHQAQKWRQENQVDNIVNETIFEFNPRPYELSGYDREGHPILIFTPTSIDIRKLMVQGLRDKIYRYTVQVVETAVAQLPEASRIFGKEINEGVAIIDFSGFNLKQHACLSCVPVFIDLVTVIETYYPWTLKYLIGINVPRIAQPLIEIMKPLLSDHTRKGLRVLSPDRREWSKFLDEIIDPDQLPYRFGGTRKN